MGLISWLGGLGGNRGGEKPAESTAASKSFTKYLYDLPTAKMYKGLMVVYRESEYRYWFMDNLDYLQQFYSYYMGAPSGSQIYVASDSAAKINGRNSWYEYSQNQSGLEKVHAPIASFITTIMTDLVFSGPVVIKISNNDALNERLQKAFAPGENDIQNFLRRADTMESVGGTLLFKCNYDKKISDYPILEFYEADKIDYMERFGRITDMISVDTFKKEGTEYTLTCDISRKGFEYELFRGGNPVEMSEAYEPGKEPKGYTYADGSGAEALGPILGVWKRRRLMSHEFPDLKLGRSDYEGLIDTFQMADETYSRFINQIRATQPVLFISEELMGFETTADGATVVKEPTDLGCKAYPLSGGVANIDGKSVAAMFNRDVPDLSGVSELSQSFEWLLRMAMTMLMLSPSTGNVESSSVGSNTTGSSMFKREQSTHLIRKGMIESWSTAIRGIVRLMCQWFDIIDGYKVPRSYDDLNIDVIFPDLDADDFDTKLDEAIKGFTAGLFDIKTGVQLALGNKVPEDTRNELIKTLEAEKRKQEEAAKAKASAVASAPDGDKGAGSNDAVSKADRLAKVAKASANAKK